METETMMHAPEESRKRPLEDQSNGMGTKRSNGVGSRKYLLLYLFWTQNSSVSRDFLK